MKQFGRIILDRSSFNLFIWSYKSLIFYIDKLDEFEVNIRETWVVKLLIFYRVTENGCVL